MRHHVYGSVAASAIIAVLRDTGPPVVGYRYIRIDILTTQGGSNAVISEIAVKTVAGGPDVVTGSETFTSSAGTAANAFDNNVATNCALGATSGWLKIDFGLGNEKQPVQIIFSSSASTAAAALPDNVEVYGSNNDATWVLLFSGSTDAWTGLTAEDRPVPPDDLNLAYTVLQMQFDGTVDTTGTGRGGVFWDESYYRHAIFTQTGTPCIAAGGIGDTATRFGSSLGGATSFGAIGILPGPEFAFGTGDFTIEGRGKLNANNSPFWSAMIGNWDGATNGTWTVGYRVDTGKLFFMYRNAGANTLTEYTFPGLGVDFHWAVSRNGDTIRLFIDGVMVAKTTGHAAVDLNNQTKTLVIGGNTTTSDYWKGYIDQLRVTKGLGRYNSDSSFTPLTVAYTRPTLPYVTDGVVEYFFSNPKLSGVVFDPNDNNLMWQDLAMTTPVTTNGDPVRVWKSKFGGVFAFIAPDDASRPLWQSGSGFTNPTAYLDFNGSKMMRMDINNFAYAKPSVFTRWGDVTAGNQALMLPDSLTGTDFGARWMIWRDSPGLFTVRINGSLTAGYVTGFGSGVNNMLGLVPEIGLGYVNGSSFALAASSYTVSGFGNLAGPVLGANGNGTGKITGKCFGVIIMDRLVDKSEVNLIATWNNPAAAEATIRPASVAKAARATMMKMNKPTIYKVARAVVMKV